MTSTKLLRAPSSYPHDCLCTIGNFDGIHQGHRAVLQQLEQCCRSQGKRSVVISFSPHPAKVLRAGDGPLTITPLRTTLHLLSELGIDLLYLVRFSQQLAELSPREFLDRVVEQHLACSGLLIGPDLRIGKDRAGTPEVIREIVLEKGWWCEQAEVFVGEDGEKTSSRTIRELLLRGDVAAARVLLGRPYEIWGKIVAGDARGRTLGFPTANIHLKESLPLRKGVYIAEAHFSERANSPKYRTVVNVGCRPTFAGESKLSVEAHLFGSKECPDGPISEDCYGERLRLRIHQFLREEQQFPSVKELVSQIKADISDAKDFFS
ncbi:riboflavin biosynthesis protein RibF [bacterium]|nr:riboflavin biosynthesis protein RibF [bacterium]